MHVRHLSLAAGVLVATAALPAIASADETASTSLAVTVQLSSRTSLKVSGQMLQFAVVAPGEPALATVDFTAAARTRPAGEVVLTVELVKGPGKPGGTAHIENAVTFSGEGDGTAAGALCGVGPSVAARWSGSGVRMGRLTFALRSAVAGTSWLPLRFVLSAP